MEKQNKKETRNKNKKLQTMHIFRADQVLIYQTEPALSMVKDQRKSPSCQPFCLSNTK